MTGRDVVGGVNCSDRAVSLAKSATDALVYDDCVIHKALADVRGTLLVNDMRDIFVLEMRKRGKNRVGRGLSESAERIVLDILRQQELSQHHSQT